MASVEDVELMVVGSLSMSTLIMEKLLLVGDVDVDIPASALVQLAALLAPASALQLITVLPTIAMSPLALVENLGAKARCACTSPSTARPNKTQVSRHTIKRFIRNTILQPRVPTRKRSP